MTSIDLLEPILDDGLKRNNFFNGRLLSAEDLRAEQEATRTQDAHLATAAGEGVAWGLGVTITDASAASPQLRVDPGLALARTGDLLHLANPVDVALVPATRAAEAAEGLFVDCATVTTSAPISGDKAYLFTISPTSGYSDSALVSDPNAASLGRGRCGSRFTVEGVRFRLIAIPFDQLNGIDDSRARMVDLLTRTGDSVSLQLLRNRLAHLCYGTLALRTFFTNPLARTGTGAGATSTWGGWGLLDAMRSDGYLKRCDVPLAVVVLTSGGIRSLDIWSVRRKLVGAGAIDEWRAVAGPRRIAEGEAAYLQFQAQLDAVSAMESRAGIVASKYFDLLPASGWLPTGSGGFTPGIFLGAHAPPGAPLPVDAALLRGIIEQSWLDEPFLLSTDPPVPLHVYQVPGESFVVFARSRLGNVRVRLAPTPASTDVVQVTSTAHTGAVTKSTVRDQGTVIVTDLAPGLHTITVEAPNYVAVAPVEQAIVGGRTVDIAIALTPLPKGWITVTALDAAGDKPINANVLSVTATGPSGTVVAGTKQSANWKIDGLDPGSYTVAATATDYTPVTSVSGTVTRGIETAVTLRFTATPSSDKRPSVCSPWVATKRLDLGKVRFCVVLAATEFQDEYYAERILKYAAQFKEGDPFSITKGEGSEDWWTGERRATADGHIIYGTTAPWDRMEPVEIDNGDLKKWLVAWARWIGRTIHDNAVAHALPRLFVDPRFVFPRTAEENPMRPAAYAVFLHFGVPLRIEAEAGRTKSPVKVEQSGLRGLRTETRELMYKVDLPDVDDLASAWNELLARVTGLAVKDAGYVAHDAAERVDLINKERTYLAGPDEPVKDALAKLDLTTDVAVANADVETLGKELGSNTLAASIIAKARDIVPRDAWSLDASDLSEVQVERLAGRGFGSKGAVVRASATEEGRTAIAESLGVAGAPGPERERAVGAVVGDATTALITSSIGTTPEVSVAAWKAVPQSTARSLAKAGFSNVDDVAKATPEEVAAKANIPLAAAKEISTNARAGSRESQDVSTLAGLTGAERTALTTALGGKGTVGEVVKMNDAALAAAFGGNADRAAAFKAGVTGGLDRGLGAPR